jgi:uncharacterized protein YdeI (YjbR/CyaY-like superfamily)
MPIGEAKPRFFKSAADFRRWLEVNYAKVRELWVGFYKKDSGKGGITYPEALDEALCYGWIDGVRRSWDAGSFTIRFTPRRAKSIWSLVNLRHFERLKKLGRVAPPGLKAHAERDPKKSGLYTFENLPRRLAAADEKLFKANKAAWDFFQAQPPSYQRVAIFWVTSAKREETQARRLALLIANSASGRRLAMLAGEK